MYILDRTKEAEKAAKKGHSKILFHIVKGLVGKAKIGPTDPSNQKELYAIALCTFWESADLKKWIHNWLTTIQAPNI